MDSNLKRERDDSDLADYFDGSSESEGEAPPPPAQRRRSVPPRLPGFGTGPAPPLQGASSSFRVADDAWPRRLDYGDDGSQSDAEEVEYPSDVEEQGATMDVEDQGNESDVSMPENSDSGNESDRSDQSTLGDHILPGRLRRRRRVPNSPAVAIAAPVTPTRVVPFDFAPYNASAEGASGASGQSVDDEQLALVQPVLDADLAARFFRHAEPVVKQTECICMRLYLPPGPVREELAPVVNRFADYLTATEDCHVMCMNKDGCTGKEGGITDNYWQNDWRATLTHAHPSYLYIILNNGVKDYGCKVLGGAVVYAEEPDEDKRRHGIDSMYYYLSTICVKNGVQTTCRNLGQEIIQNIKRAMKQQGVRFFVLRALTHVISYYYDKMGFRLLHELPAFGPTIQAALAKDIVVPRASRRSPAPSMDALLAAHAAPFRELGFMSDGATVTTELSLIHRRTRDTCLEIAANTQRLSDRSTTSRSEASRLSRMSKDLQRRLEDILYYEQTLISAFGWSIQPRRQGQSEAAYEAMVAPMRKGDNEIDGIYMWFADSS